MNTYEEKRARRIARLEEAAARRRKESEATLKRAHEMAEVIPFGQPILIGHHSEGRDRRYRARIEGKYRKGFEALEHAQSLEERARAAAENTAISSDDPEAIEKLTAKLEQLKFWQEDMKRINKLHGAYVKKPASLPEDLPESELELIKTYEPRYSWEPHPFAPYMLTNNSANIRRIEQRIRQLEARKKQQTTEQTIGEVRIVDNVEANRIQVFFPGKPDQAIRTTLKHGGFRWTPSLECWQAYRGNNARWTLERLFNKKDE